MGKSLIISDANFSENAVQIDYVPMVIAKGFYDVTRFVKALFNLDDDAGELVGKTIIGFDVQFSNDLNNATKSAIVTLGNQIIPVSCDFVEGDTVKTKTYMLEAPFTFAADSVIGYEVTGNVDDNMRGGCDVFAKERSVAGVADYAFAVSREGYPPLETKDYMPFKKFILAI